VGAAVEAAAPCFLTEVSMETGERREPEGSKPSTNFLPLFEIGRVAGQWCLSDGDTFVRGDNKGVIIGA
jgi:hypothetical protein